jgi:hypothetical protein
MHTLLVFFLSQDVLSENTKFPGKLRSGLSIPSILVCPKRLWLMPGRYTTTRMSGPDYSVFAGWYARCIHLSREPFGASKPNWTEAFTAGFSEETG